MYENLWEHSTFYGHLWWNFMTFNISKFINTLTFSHLEFRYSIKLFLMCHYNITRSFARSFTFFITFEKNAFFNVLYSYIYFSRSLHLWNHPLMKSWTRHCFTNNIYRAIRFPCYSGQGIQERMFHWKFLRHLKQFTFEQCSNCTKWNGGQVVSACPEICMLGFLEVCSQMEKWGAVQAVGDRTPGAPELFEHCV